MMRSWSHGSINRHRLSEEGHDGLTAERFGIQLPRARRTGQLQNMNDLARAAVNCNAGLGRTSYEIFVGFWKMVDYRFNRLNAMNVIRFPKRRRDVQILQVLTTFCAQHVYCCIGYRPCVFRKEYLPTRDCLSVKGVARFVACVQSEDTQDEEEAPDNNSGRVIARCCRAG